MVMLVPMMASAQTAPSPGPAALDAVVKELRLLRQAVERQGLATARAQLLVGRLTLQDQRTARAQQAVERLQSEVASAQRERDELQRSFRAIAQRLEQASADEPRQQLEEESRMTKARLADSQAHVSGTELRLSQAKQALDIETGRYDELDVWLKDLDRQLQASGQ
jgi:predicted  nucleic acid-binding Zn-ribbon protein